MEETTALKPGGDFMTLLDLLRKVAAHKSLVLHEGGFLWCSEAIKEYVLDERLMKVLEEHNIKRHHRKDCNYSILTLVDENPQEFVQGHSPGNYWNFRRHEGGNHFDLRIALSVYFVINIQKRGVVFVPNALGPFVSATERLPNFRMFKALVESDTDAPAVAKEIASSDGTIVATWTEIGLGGIRRLSDLFVEFIARNEAIDKLGRRGGVFDPNPYPCYRQPGDELFIPEPAQPEIIKGWRTQLNEYRSQLFA